MAACSIDNFNSLWYIKYMVNDQSSHAMQQISALSKFDLTFEYNKTLQEVRREVRIRTEKA